MNMTEWAKNEIEIACKKERGNKPTNEWDYGCACYESAYKAFLSLMDDEHSGFSIGVAKSILNRLIDGKPLSPIEDTPDIWGDDAICEFDNCTTYQCKRMSSLFKDVYKDGTVKYHDVNRFYCLDRDNHNVCGWYNGFISRLLDTLFPIVMPYNPASKPWYVYCTEGLSDPKNGDFDTIGIWYILKPDGERVEINRFFKDGEDDWIEICQQEYDNRVNCTKNTPPITKGGNAHELFSGS